MPLPRIFALGACLLAAAAAAQAPGDPLEGRWELNVARTHYGGGAQPRVRETFACLPVDAGVKCTIQSVMANGETVRGGFGARYDGPPGPTEGIPGVDRVRLTRVNGAVADATFTSQGRPVFAYRAVRSDDGRSLTIVSVDPFSRVVLHSVVVYDLR
jgi:hypothetical protein